MANVMLPVHFHPQRDPDWCDPADIQMWLELDGVYPASADEGTVQSQLWAYELSHNDGFTLAQWHASPYAVAVTLDHFGHRTGIGDGTFTDVQAAGAVISGSVAGKHEPVIALVDDGSHYVLVSGVTLGPDGPAAAPTSVVVNDPWTYAPTRDGYATIGTSVRMSWAAFVLRFTPDDPHDLGIWPGHWVLIAAGQPLQS
jgi:hypothetical protein